MTRFLWGIAVLGAAACGSSGSQDAGPPVSAQQYFNLEPGLCFVYDGGAGGIVSLDVVTVASPAGVALHQSLNGVDQAVDFVTFDGGLAFLAEQELVASQSVYVQYTSPLLYLSAPLAAATLNSSSPFMSTGTPPSGTETLAAAVTSSTQAWSGFGADAGADETKLTFSFSGDAGTSLVESWVVPGLGFTDLYLSGPNGFTDYLLTRVHPDDAGCP